MWLILFDSPDQGDPFALKAKVILHIPLVELGNDLVFVLVGVDHKLDDAVGIESIGYVHSTYPTFYQGRYVPRY